MTAPNITKTKTSKNLHALKQRIVQNEVAEANRQIVDEVTDFKAEGLYKAVFESVSDSIVIIDRKGRIVDFNNRLLEIGGYTRDELAGKNFRDLIGMVSKKGLALMAANFLKSMDGIPIPPYEVEIFKKDREQITIEISTFPLRKNGKLIGDSVLLRDITERKKKDSEIRQKTSEIQLINSINEAANRGLSLKEIIAAVSEEIMKLYNGFAAITYFLSEDKQYLESANFLFPSAMVTAIEKLYQTKMSAIRFKIRENGVYSGILKTEKVQVNNDSFVIQKMAKEYTDDKTLQQVLPILTRFMGLHSVISIPLISEGETIGLLDIARHENSGDLDTERIQTIASQFVNVIKRKQAENNLKENEEKYRLIVENTRDLIFTVDGENRYIYVSPSIKPLLGYEPAEITGKPFISFIHPDDRHIIEEEIRISLLPGYRMSGNSEYRVRNAAGGWRWHNGTGSLVHDENGKTLYFLGVARDITDRKHTEQALKASEQNFRNSLDKSPMGVRIVDAAWNTLYANQVFMDILGYKNIAEIDKVKPEDLFPPEEYLRYLGRREKALAGEIEPDKLEMDIYRMDGAVRRIQVTRSAVLWDGKTQFQILYSDITERKKAENDLKASETRYHELVNTITSGVFIYQAVDNGEDFIFVDVNSAAEKMEGISRKNIIGKRMTEVLPGARDYYLFKVFQRVSRSGNSEYFSSGERTDEQATGRWRDNWAYKLPSGEIVNVYDDISERKIAENALKLSEQNFRNSMDSSFMGIRIVDQEGHILYSNQAFLDIFGYADIDDALTHPPRDQFTPGSYRDFTSRVDKIKRGEPAADMLEIDIIRKDGALRHLQLFYKIVFWNGTRRYQTLYHDITERKLAEEAVKESEEKYRTIFESVNDIIILMDVNGTVLDVNGRLNDVAGYEREELIGKNFQDLEFVMDAANMHTASVKLGEIIASNHVVTYQYQLMKKNREIGLAEITGITIRKENKIAGILLIVRDITERNKAELRIREQKALTDRILGSTPNAVAVVGQDLRIIIVNKAFERTFTLTEGVSAGKEIGEIIPVPGLIAAISKVFACGDSRHLEARFSQSSLVKTLVVDIINTRQHEVLVMLRDITEERALQERLYLTDRLASVGEMAAGIAHELNNPLTGVVALSQLLLESGVPDDIKADMEAISSEGQRAAVIVKNLLSFARSHTLTAEPTDITLVIGEVLKLRAHEHSMQNIEVSTRFAGNLPNIVIDRFQMQQVFLNIILNAEQAMAESLNTKKSITVSAEIADGIVLISFANSGPEIPPDIMNRIFDPFFTTKEVGKGTGLGLSISYGIVANQGGKIYARNLDGKGVVFIIELPVNAH